MNGQKAYEAYAAHRKGVSHDGNPLPDWAGVTDDNKKAWEAFGKAATMGVPPDDAYNKVYLNETKGKTIDGKPAPSYLFFHHNAPDIAEAWKKAWEAARS